MVEFEFRACGLQFKARVKSYVVASAADTRAPQLEG